MSLAAGRLEPLAVGACPLCGAATRDYYRDEGRDYRQCDRCALVHVPAHQHLDPAAELAEYRLHDNRVNDPGYRRFLAQLADPLLERVEAPAHALDFGCGPGPALAAMLEAAGLTVDLFDPFFAPDTLVFTRRYQVITASEVVEHLARPGPELERLWSLLDPGGWLGIMTRRLPDAAAFPRWGYRREPTHIAFFADATFHYLANHWDCELHLPSANVALLRKLERS